LLSEETADEPALKRAGKEPKKKAPRLTDRDATLARLGEFVALAWGT
jgi:hypothetical protein